MKKRIIPILLLTLSSVFTFGHATAAPQPSAANIEQTTTQPNLTANQLVERAKAAYNQKNFTEAVNLFRKAAELGDGDALHGLGFMYEKGYGVGQDYSEAVKWYRKAAEQGNALGQNFLGHMYHKGYGVATDYSEAVKWYRKAAEQGHVLGQSNLAYMYEEGLGVPQNYSEAKKWYLKAAEQGSEKAQHNLAYIYEKGFGGVQDYYEAVKWYRKAAEQGFPIPQFRLGNMYYNGYGVAKDLAEARKWWEKAAAQGLPAAQESLKKLPAVDSQLVEKGKAAKDSKNYTEAVSYFRKAAEQGDAEGEYWLSHMYFYGYGVPKDYTECIKWCRKSADHGNAEGQNSLGKLYYHGTGTSKNYTEAMKWWKSAAEKEHAAAQYNLALLYEKGLGGPKDLSEAMKWFRKSAEQGMAAAQTALGNYYYYGDVVSKDYSEAMKWWKKAAEQGDVGGQNNLALIYEKGLGVPQDYSEAVKWYRKSAEQGDAYGQNALGYMYQHGYGVAKDLAEARKWWEKSAAQGFKEAQENLKKLPTPTPAPVVGIPTLAWIECPAKTATPQFALKVGVNSKSAITDYNVVLNGSTTRGIKTVKNDGYDLMIDQPLTLAEGNNEIRVEATNASGRTVETRSVVYEKPVKPSPTPAQVQKRIALVVGNGAYSGAPLRNTLNDAAAIASELRGLGFEVISVSDANKKKFDSAVNDFGLRARDYDVAMFYYAGHGIQYKGENFLVPVDATLSTQSDVEYECVNVNRILSKLEDSEVKMKIIALDACRNNPFERSWHRGEGGSRGLSAINIPMGTVISYATSPGTVAADGAGDHSPYTSALLQTLKEKNLPIENVFKKVASIVVSNTGRTQLPWYTSSLFEGEFVFNPAQK